MKTYMPMTENRDGIHYPEMYEAEGGEWVPAEVAQRLYDALRDMITSYEALGAPLALSREVEIALEALAAADGEEV